MNNKLILLNDKNENNTLDKIMNNFDKKIGKIFSYKNSNKIFFIIGIFIIVSYLIIYFYLPPIVDEEVREDITNNLKPWEVKKGESFINALLTRPFNLNITEQGQYRPRYLAFVVQFIDENIYLRLTRSFPALVGNRQPFYVVASILTVISIYHFVVTISKKKKNGLAFFLASTVLIFQNYQVSTYWRARSAKLLALPVCIFLINYALRISNEKICRKKIYKLLYVVPIFLLMTLDEQVLAIVVMLCALLIFLSFVNKKVSLGSVIYSVASFIYATFHLWWGKAIFLHFTGNLSKHGHTVSGSIRGISIKTIKEAIEILCTTITKLIYSSGSIIFLFIILEIIIIILQYVKNNSKIKENYRELCNKIIVPIFLLCTSIVLLMLMIDAHEEIYLTPCLWKSVYILIPTVILYLNVIYLIQKVSSKYNNIKLFIFLLFIIMALVLNYINISNYYGAYLVEKGGFRNDFSDLVVDQDNINIRVFRSKDMDIDNNSFTSALNTIFSTDDVKTTKIIYGKNKDSMYIDKEFSCYLINRENRNLHLNLKLNDYNKFDYITIFINKKEIKNIKINSNEIVEDFFVTTEINRACKVKIELTTKQNENIDNGEIILNELYIK